MGNAFSCSTSCANACPRGFRQKTTCKWIWWVDEDICVLDAQEGGSLPAQVPSVVTKYATEPDDIVCRGSRYVVSGSCSRKACDPADPASCASDAVDPPPCSDGDAQDGDVTVSC